MIGAFETGTLLRSTTYKKRERHRHDLIGQRSKRKGRLKRTRSKAVSSLASEENSRLTQRLVKRARGMGLSSWSRKIVRFLASRLTFESVEDMGQAAKEIRGVKIRVSKEYSEASPGAHGGGGGQQNRAEHIHAWPQFVPTLEPYPFSHWPSGRNASYGIFVTTRFMQEPRSRAGRL